MSTPADSLHWHIEPRRHVNPACIPDPALRAEWRHFADFGWTDEKIANKLRLDMKTVQRWVLRHKERSK